MKRKTILGLFLLILCLSVVGTAIAQVTSYQITWWSVDQGGAVAKTGDGYSLSGSMGQPDAGQAISEGSYQINGGFWVIPENNYIFLPQIMHK